MATIEGLVSVVVTTRNSARFIGRTLESIKRQTYPNVEVIIVDRFSTDGTAEIAKKYTEKVYSYGTERNEQRAYAFSKASGEYYLHHASDLILPPTAIEECVELVNKGWDGVEIDWVPDAAMGFWAKVRVLEMTLYIKNQRMFRPNFARLDTFRRSGGYNKGVKVAGDDYQIKLHFDRIGAKVTSAKSIMLHIGEPRCLSDWVRKDVYYGKSLKPFWEAEGNAGKLAFAPPLRTYWRNRSILLRSGPRMFIAFVFYRSVRYASGAIGLMLENANGGKDFA